MTRRLSLRSLPFLLLFGLASCVSSSRNNGVASDAGSDALGPVTGGVTIQPSAVSQTISQGGVSVTIPGGLLSVPTTLTIAPSATATQLAKPTPDTAILGAYDISLGTTSTFDKPITIEIPYDPAKLDPDSPEGKNLWVSSWDPTSSRWSIPPIDVDTVRKVITVHTYHLSTWIYWTLQGYKYVDSTDGAFEVYYHPNHAQPRLDVGAMTPTYTMRDLATDTAVTLATARQRYDAANFTVPSGQVKTIITDAGNSNMDPYSGNIFLDRKEQVSLAVLMHDAAHELFHVVQNQYLNIWGMSKRRWWIEGTPDYAASVVAWDDPTTLPPLEATYFSDPFTASTENDLAHCYQNSNFVHYLVGRRALDFTAMWEAVATNSIIGDNGFPALQKYVAAGTGATFDQVWVDFVDYEVFDPASPMALMQTTSFTVTEAAKQGSRTTIVPSYGAALVMMEAAPSPGKQTRSVKLSASGMASGTTVEIWQAQSRDRKTASLKSVLVDNSSSWSIEMGTTDRLFAMVHNTGTAERSVTVTAATADVADAGVDAGNDAGKDAGDAGAGTDASAGKWTLQVVFKGAGSGQVLGSGTTCTASCTYTRNNASDLTLIPYPDSLSGFIGWDVISCTKGTATFNPYGCSAYVPECTSFYATDDAVCSIGANFALK
jgi:hypothetical protein